MRKLVYLFTCFISFLLFFSTFQYHSQLQRHQIFNLLSLIARERNQALISLPLNIGIENREENLAMVMDFCYTHQYTLIAYQNYQRADMLNNDVIYIYSNDTFNDLSFFKTMDNKYINFSEDTTNYFSSHKNDPNSYDTIEFLNPTWNNSHQHLIEIKSFFNYARESMENVIVNVQILGDDEEKIKADILNSEIHTMIHSNDFFTLSAPDYAVENLANMYLLVIICAIAITLFYIAEIVKQKQRLIVRKLFGQSTLFIIYKEFLPTLIKTLALFGITQLICYAILVQRISELTIPFIFIILRTMVVYLASLLFILLFLFAIINKSCTYLDLKKGDNNNFLPIMSFILKMVLLLLTINPVIEIIDNGIDAFQIYYILSNNKEKLKDNAFIWGFRYGDDIVIDNENKETLVTYFMNHNAIYQDFRINYINSQLKEAGIEGVPEYSLPYIEVNLEYLNFYQLYMQDGQKLDIERLEHNTLLVPKKYKDENLGEGSAYNPFGEYTIQYIQNGNKFYSYFPSNQLISLYKIDPIILLKTEVDEGMQLVGGNLILRIEEDASKEEIINYFKEQELQEIVNISDSNMVYENVKRNSIDSILEVVALITLYIILIIMFLYQNTFIYFYENKKLLALQYILGKNFVQRNKLMLQISVLTYILPALIWWLIFPMEIRSIIVFMSFTIAIDLLILYLMIRKFEKSNVGLVLKGAE